MPGITCRRLPTLCVPPPIFAEGLQPPCTIAEHTGFGEAPASALPDYSPVRRTLSARVEGSSSSGSGRGVGESLSRSLEYLRRQSSLQHQQVEEDASAAGGLPTSPNAAVQANSQPSAEPACSPPAAQQPGSPSEGARELGRVRQQGSFKEQAGEFEACCA